MKNKLLNYLTLIAIIVAFSFFIILQIQENYLLNIFTYIGLSLIIPSIILFTIARFQLGNSFQVSAEANNLVTGGLYKKIRHPIYFFSTIFILGFILFIHLYYLLIIWIALIILQKSRIKNEEKVLEEKFGAKYKEYKKGTWF